MCFAVGYTAVYGVRSSIQSDKLFAMEDFSAALGRLPGGVAAPGWVPDLLLRYSRLPGAARVSKAELQFNQGTGGVKPILATSQVLYLKQATLASIGYTPGESQNDERYISSVPPRFIHIDKRG